MKMKKQLKKYKNRAGDFSQQGKQASKLSQLTIHFLAAKQMIMF